MYYYYYYYYFIIIICILSVSQPSTNYLKVGFVFIDVNDIMMKWNLKIIIIIYHYCYYYYYYCYHYYSIIYSWLKKEWF